jgi:hypothetical protein
MCVIIAPRRLGASNATHSFQTHQHSGKHQRLRAGIVRIMQPPNLLQPSTSVVSTVRATFTASHVVRLMTSRGLSYARWPFLFRVWCCSFLRFSRSLALGIVSTIHSENDCRAVFLSSLSHICIFDSSSRFRRHLSTFMYRLLGLPRQPCRYSEAYCFSRRLISIVKDTSSPYLVATERSHLPCFFCASKCLLGRRNQVFQNVSRDVLAHLHARHMAPAQQGDSWTV